jgi:acyl carrier protein
MDVTIEDIQTVVAVQLGRKRVPPDARIIEDLGAESLDVVNIVAALEERYGILIEEVELPDLVTVADLHACVRSRVADDAG